MKIKYFALFGLFYLLYSHSANALEYPSISVMFAGKNLDEKWPSAKELSHYDIIITQGWPATLIEEVKTLNSNIELLRASQGPWVNTNGYGSEILNAEGFKREFFLLHHSDGSEITWWNDAIVFYNFASTEAVDWLADYVMMIYNQEPGKSYYTGMYFDGLHYTIWDWIKKAIYTTNPEDIDIDADGNGIKDSQGDFDQAWSSGIIRFLEKLNDLNLHIVANDAPDYDIKYYKDYLQGATFENQLTYWLEGKDWFFPWSGIIELGNSWIAQAKQPPLSLALLGGPSEVIYSSKFNNPYILGSGSVGIYATIFQIRPL
ncbi:MAG: hypothetical protein WAX66_01165 [Patescibacteria group bacterium]